MRIFISIIVGLMVTSCAFKSPITEIYETSDIYDQLVWSDEFEQSEIDTTQWNLIIGDGCPDLCGFGNNELQYYTDAPENIRIKDGKLIIQAHKESKGSQSYTSAKLVSEGKGDWKYGRIEFRAKIPNGKGTWPALWMMPTLNRDVKWPVDGEIDIMEHVGYNPGVVYGVTHTANFNGLNGNQKSDSLRVETASDEFHVYALEWESDRLGWYIDQEKFFELNKQELHGIDWAFDKKFHLIMNLAIGGNWGGIYGVDNSTFPQTLEIDYVRVYQ